LFVFLFGFGCCFWQSPSFYFGIAAVKGDPVGFILKLKVHCAFFESFDPEESPVCPLSPLGLDALYEIVKRADVGIVAPCEITERFIDVVYSFAA